MQNRPVNAGQLAVLAWIAAGAQPGQEPAESYKTSAIALQGRGLVTVRRSPTWTASLTERGSYYLQHHTYPPTTPATVPAPAPARVRSERSAPVTNAPPTHAPRATRRPAPEVPLATSPDDPHPALRALTKQPAKLLGFSEQINQRCILIAHTLVREARAHGWKISAGSTDKRPTASGWQWPTGTNALFFLDAGHQPVGVGFNIKYRQVDHTLTVEEARQQARHSWSGAPRYDYQPTDVLRLDLYVGGSRDYRLEDKGYPIEDRLHLVLARIPQASQNALDAAEAARLRQIEAARRAEEEQRRQQLRSAYDRWLSVLQSEHQTWQYHQSLATFVTQLNAAVQDLPAGEFRDQATAYAHWAADLVEATDPLRDGLRVPTSDRPELDHDERFDHEPLRDPTAATSRPFPGYGW